MPVLRREVSPTAIVVLKETESVENVDDESDGRKLYVDPSTRLSGSVVVESHVHSTPDFQLTVKIWRHSNNILSFTCQPSPVTQWCTLVYVCNIDKLGLHGWHVRLVITVIEE